MAAERAWTLHLLPRMEQAIRQEGYVQAVADQGCGLVIREGSLDIVTRGTSSTISTEHLAAVWLQHPWLHIWTTEARTLGWRGKFRLRYSRVPNAQALMILIERFVCGHVHQLEANLPAA